MPFLNERGFGRHSERVTQIFRHADGMTTIKPLFEAYFRQFPNLPLHLDALDQLFQESGMNTRFLAVPIDRIQAVHPWAIAADIGDLFGKQTVTLKPYGLMVLPSQAALEHYANRNALRYSRVRNTRNLRNAGFIVNRSNIQQALHT